MTRTPIFNNPLPESTDLIKRQDLLDLSNNMETKAMAASQYDGDGAVKAAGGMKTYVTNSINTKAMLPSQYDSDGTVKAAGGIKPYVTQSVNVNMMAATQYDPAGKVKAAGGIPAYVFEALYPVGISVTFYVPGNPGSADKFGRGTWVECAVGRVQVGINTGDADFNTVGRTGGRKAVTLDMTNLPSLYTSSVAPGTAGNREGWAAGNVGSLQQNKALYQPSSVYDWAGNVGRYIPFSILPPYETVYIWRRTA